MKSLKQLLAVVFTFCLLSAGAVAFEPQGGDKQRPPKQEKEVPKSDKRESGGDRGKGSNNSGDRKDNDNKRGRP